MATRVIRWGNSLAIRIPKTCAHELRLHEGAEVELTIADGRLVVTPTTRPVFSLAELVAGITPDNRHEEADWGDPVGCERR
jgi:antitoxin MazE